MIFICFVDMTLNVHAQNDFCNFSVEWLTYRTQSNYKSCKIGHMSKFTFEATKLQNCLIKWTHVFGRW